MDVSVDSFIRALVAVLCAGALILVLVILDGPESDHAIWQTTYSALALTLFSLSGFAGWSLARRGGTAALVGLATAILSVLALAAAVNALIHVETALSRPRAVEITAVLALVGGQASVFLSLGRDDDPISVRLIRIGTLLTLAALGVIALLAFAGHDINPKLLSVLSVLYLLGALLLPLLRLLPQPGR